MPETIDRHNAANFGEPESTIGGDAPLGPEPAQTHHHADSQANVNIEQELSAAAGEGGSKSNFRHLPNSFCWPA
jgi:hypothetical protein